jgi:SnoaL-like polyketide cyclase
MKGFDKRWKDLPDYILGITKEIWEDRNVHTLHGYYGKNMAKRAPDGVVVGAENVIAETLGALATAPGIQILGEDVIWSGNEDEGFLSSHRSMTFWLHTQDGPLGKATGKLLWQHCIADCACRDNVIYDEWLVHDTAAYVRQLDLDPKTYAEAIIMREGGLDKCRKPFTPDHDVAAEYVSRGNDHPVGQRYADLMERIMSADMAAIQTEYDRACHLRLPGGVNAHGRSAADVFWLGLRAAFPSAKFEIHHQIGREDQGFSPRAALRWSLTGTHDGWGAFGTPTGAKVHVMGISHSEFGPWGLRREYVLYDEIAIWKQIILKSA